MRRCFDLGGGFRREDVLIVGSAAERCRACQHILHVYTREHRGGFRVDLPAEGAIGIHRGDDVKLAAGTSTESEISERRTDVEPDIIAVAPTDDVDEELFVASVIVAAQSTSGKDLDVEPSRNGILGPVDRRDRRLKPK